MIHLSQECCCSFDAAVPSLVSAACVAAAASFVPAVFQSSCFEKIYLETCSSNVPAGSSSNVPADYVSAGHVLIPANRDRIY
ncbi:hypothetical protein Tco_0238893 [Tanacetum coccineum]